MLLTLITIDPQIYITSIFISILIFNFHIDLRYFMRCRHVKDRIRSILANSFVLGVRNAGMHISAFEKHTVD